jgi:hypothetical protein
MPTAAREAVRFLLAPVTVLQRDESLGISIAVVGDRRRQEMLTNDPRRASAARRRR